MTEVHSICGQRVTGLHPISEEVELPSEIGTIETQIQTLTEISWLLDLLLQHMRVNLQIMGDLGREGSLTDHTWEIRDQVVDPANENSLPRRTGISAEELSLESIIREVVSRLEAEDNALRAAGNLPINTGDIAKLNAFIDQFAEIYNQVRQASPEGEHAATAVAYAGIPTLHQDNQNFKFIIKAILDRLIGSGVLPTEIISQINIGQIVYSTLDEASIQAVMGQVDSMITARCGRYAELIPEPPVIAPPLPPPPPPTTTPEPEEELQFNFALSLAPAYGLLIYGNENDPPFENTFSLHGFAGARLDFNNELSLQIDYAGLHEVSEDFSYSRVAQDAAYVSMAIENYIPQLAFLTQYNHLNGERSFWGVAGFGVNLYDGLLYPFAGGLFGTSFGGYVGARSSYIWDAPLGAEDMSLGLSGQVLYRGLWENRHEVGASASFFWSPFSLGDIPVRIGASVGGAYAYPEDSANILFGLTLGYGPVLPQLIAEEESDQPPVPDRLPMLAPQPVSVRQLLGGY
jgi:hypothetical protein